MPAAGLVSVQEYLSTAYRPDCDYVDGVVVERNLGEIDHASLQGAVFYYLHARRKQFGGHVFPELRVQVAPTRFCIPDVCVVLGPKPRGRILTVPPFICIEILSKDDRLAAMQKRVGDFLRFGVPYVWILDPESHKAFRCTLEGMSEVGELRTENPEMVVPLEALFED
jgi:Uma2 family endonuclease